jgi:hypothetical protein
MTVKALAMAPGLPESRILTSDFRQFHPVGRIRLQTGYDAQYTGGGPNALTDGIRGKADFRLGGWQGYHGVDLDAVLDLDSVKDLKHVSLGCLQDVTSWIFFPDSVGFSFSVDGMSFGKSIDLPNTVSQHDAAVTVRDFGTDLPSGTRARYVRVKAKNIGRCPPWHPGAGEKAWLFVDEISVDAK